MTHERPDYSFMRSGVGAPTHGENSVDFEMKLMCLLKILVEKSIEIAADYCEHAKRNTVTGKDMVYALKYQAHEFLTAETETELAEKLHEYLNDDDSSSLLLFAPTNDTDDDDSDDESDSGGSEPDSDNSHMDSASDDNDSAISSDDDETDEFTESRCECDMCTKINSYNREWDDWQPSEEMHIIFKNAVNRANSTLT